jgi:voltage-gated sodium channel
VIFASTPLLGSSVRDFIIVVTSFALLFVGSGFLNALRILRVLRVLRSFNALTNLRVTINSLFAALNSVGHIVFIMIVIMYIFAIMGVQFFSGSSEKFANLGAAMITLFQVSTLDGWTEIMRPLVARYEFAWIYSVVFIIIKTFIVLNLFIAIILKNMEEERMLKTQDSILAELRELQHGNMVRLENKLAANQMRMIAGIEEIKSSLLKNIDEKLSVTQEELITELDKLKNDSDARNDEG